MQICTLYTTCITQLNGGCNSSMILTIYDYTVLVLLVFCLFLERISNVITERKQMLQLRIKIICCVCVWKLKIRLK